MTQDVFNQENPVDDPNKGQVFTEGNDKATSELVGEGKKYTSQAELEKAYTNADAFIKQLQRENKEMREDLSKRQTAQEIIDQMKSNEQSATPSTQEQTNPEVSLDKIQEMVRQTITAQEKQNTASNNVQEAHSFMVEKYGEKAAEVTKQQAGRLGMSLDDLKNIAAQSPSAFKRLVGEEVSQSTQQTNTYVEKSSVNTENFNADSSTPERVAQHYRDMRKSDPTRYYSSATQNEIFKLAQQGKIKL